MPNHTVTYTNDTPIIPVPFSNPTIVTVDGDRRGIISFDNTTSTYYYTIDEAVRIGPVYGGHSCESFQAAQDLLIHYSKPLPLPPFVWTMDAMESLIAANPERRSRFLD